jgi:hypothetical protein
MSQRDGLLAAVVFLALVVAIIYFPWPDRSGRVEVTGLVTLDGAPLEVIPGSNVAFEGVDLSEGKERVVSGLIDGQSRYRVDVHSSARGVFPGRYKVSVKAWKRLPGWNPDDPYAYASMPPAAVPKRYEDADESGITVEVTPERSQTIDIKLTK